MMNVVLGIDDLIFVSILTNTHLFFFDCPFSVQIKSTSPADCILSDKINNLVP